jgi:predicted permease
MTLRLRSWMQETHGAGFELVRHFIARFFDSEMVSTPGEWRKVAIGLLAALASVSVMGVRMYFKRYTFAHSPAHLTGEVYEQFARADVLSFIAVVMAATILLTLLQWQSLFPSVRDLLALAGLPVSSRQIFQAKFIALLLFFALFVLAATVPPSVVFATVSAGRWQQDHSALVNIFGVFAALAGASAFVFFSLLALQGLLLNVLPGPVFSRVSLTVQALLFVATTGAIPLLWRQPTNAEWWPPVWFLRLWEAIAAGRSGAGQTAVLAIAIPAVVCVLAYIGSYHRHRRLLLEAPRHRQTAATGFFETVLERWITEPRGQAAFAFIWKSLARSRVQRLILLAYAGAALGWIVKGALDTPTPTLRDQGMYGFLAVVVPLALAMLITNALRYVFGLPVTLEANWVFRIIDRDGRTVWLDAVERFVIWCGIAPVFAISLPAAVAILGPVRATVAMVLTFFASLLWFEAMFREWRKLPFTCSYLPTKRPLLVTILRCSFAMLLLVPAGHLILRNSETAIPFGTLLSFQFVVWWKLRQRRRGEWAQCGLCYEEVPERDVSPLELKAAEEEFEQSHAGHQHRDLFSDTLVESRGLVPHDWVEEIREDRRRPSLLLEAFIEDFRLAFRLIRRNPLVASVVVLTLTVGIGINASAFTVVNAFALRAHVYKEPDAFVRVVPKARYRDRVREASYAEYTALRDHSRTLRHLAAYAHFPAFIGKDDSAGSVGMAASCNLFVVDGLDRPLLGRLFTEDDCGRRRPPVAIINESLWRARFASDPNIIDRVVNLNSRPIRVIGVAPDRTTGWTRKSSIWVPFTAQDFFEPGADLFGREQLWLRMAGRLSPGFSRYDAQAELTALARQQDRLHAGRDTVIVTNDGSWIKEIQLTFTGQQLMLLGFFFGAFNLVLFVCCANVATLLLSRAAARRKEIAVRLSLGAPRMRLVRMLVTESLVLAGIAGVISGLLAWWLPVRLFEFIAARPADFPIEPDWLTFLFVAAIVILTGVLAGLAPALESLKGDLAASMKGGAPGTAGLLQRRGWNLQGVLVSAQVAMSMVLLVEASLFARAEERTLRTDPGFLSRNVVVAHLWFADDTPLVSVAARTAAIAERARALPGVHSVAFSAGIPMWAYETVEVKPPGRPDAIQPVDVHTASFGFFDTLGIPVLRGREFQLGESSSVIVSQSLARMFWRREDPIGKPLTLPAGTFTVVGVVRDVDPLRFGGSENPVLYVPWLLGRGNVMSVRFDSGVAMGASAVRAAIHDVDPNLISMAQRLQTWIDHVTKELWNVVGLVVMLGFVATILATTGIYGAVSFAVNQRTKELAIRAALGARKIDIVREVFRSGGMPVAKGLLAGLWLSAAMAGGLHETAKASPLRLDTSNPALYASAALLIVCAAVAAMAIPAQRGAKADPLNSLRCE